MRIIIKLLCALMILFIVGCDQEESNITVQNCECFESTDCDIDDTSDQSDTLVPENIFKKIYQHKINFNKNEYTSIFLNTNDVFQTTEGSTVEVILKDMDIVKFRVHYFGEMGQVARDYYLIDKQSFFVEEQYWNYPEPFKVEDAKITFTTFYVEGDVGYQLDDDLVEIDKNIIKIWLIQ